MPLPFVRLFLILYMGSCRSSRIPTSSFRPCFPRPYSFQHWFRYRRNPISRILSHVFAPRESGERGHAQGEAERTTTSSSRSQTAGETGGKSWWEASQDYMLTMQFAFVTPLKMQAFHMLQNAKEYAKNSMTNYRSTGGGLIQLPKKRQSLMLSLLRSEASANLFVTPLALSPSLDSGTIQMDSEEEMEVVSILSIGNVDGTHPSPSSRCSVGNPSEDICPVRALKRQNS
ncbi:hypothetical protein B0H14DRAFT_2590877 [Mycena olivaceomarginata]|nr:hypothetical protein B0H14DRAFT_2590877 [Mycena olivaceomarginata]